MEDLEKKIKEINSNITKKLIKNKICKPFRCVANNFDKMYRQSKRSMDRFVEYFSDKYYERKRKVEADKKFQKEAQERYEQYLTMYRPDLTYKYTIKMSVDKNSANGADCFKTEIVCHTEQGPLIKKSKTLPPFHRRQKIEYEGFVKDSKGKYVYVVTNSIYDPILEFEDSYYTIVRNKNGKFTECVVNNKDDSLFKKADSTCSAFMSVFELDETNEDELSK